MSKKQCVFVEESKLWFHDNKEIQCKNEGHIEREGKLYCRTHDPVRIKALKELKEAKCRIGDFPLNASCTNEMGRLLAAIGLCVHKESDYSKEYEELLAYIKSAEEAREKVKELQDKWDILNR